MATKVPAFFRRGPRPQKKTIELIKNWHIVRGDFVEVINGPHKGKQGEIVGVIRDQNKVIVENINMVSIFEHLWLLVDSQSCFCSR